MNLNRRMLLAIAALSLAACDGAPLYIVRSGAGSAPPDTIAVLALGDSYTIGEGVPESQSWPAQLADSLVARGVAGDVDVTYVAQTGWTTTALLAAIDTFAVQSGAGRTFDRVTVQIGVNNQFAQLDEALYATDFEDILVAAIVFAGGGAGAVIVLSIPDYGVTPVGSKFGAERIAEEIDRYNRTSRVIADQYGATYADITPLSREAAGDPTLVARDGLHFSGKMYARWVSLLLSLAWSSAVPARR